MRQQHRIIYLLLIVAIQFSACKNSQAPKKDVTKRSTSKVEQPLRSAEKPSNAYEERVKKANEAVQRAEKRIRDYNEERSKEEEKRIEAIKEQGKKRTIESMRERSKEQIRSYEGEIRYYEGEIKKCQEKLKIRKDELASTVDKDEVEKISKKIEFLEGDIEVLSKCMARMDAAKKEIENSLGHEEEEFEEAYEKIFKRKYSSKSS